MKTLEQPFHEPPLDDIRWRAVINNDVTMNGRFYYGVVTTGVYCRPSCPSRNPKRTNVLFFETRAQAELSGLRACKRCKSDEDLVNDRPQHKTGQTNGYHGFLLRSMGAEEHHRLIDAKRT